MTLQSRLVAPSFLYKTARFVLGVIVAGASVWSTAASSANPGETTSSNNERSPLRILNIGDSLSNGKHLHSLQALFVEGGFSNYEFVGPVKKGGTPKQTHRQAYGGMTLDAMLNGRVLDGKVQPGAVVSVSEYKPDVILLMGGINNIVRLPPENIGPAQVEWSALVDFLVKERPDATIFASNVIGVHPDRKWSAKQPVIDRFNDWLKQEIGERSKMGQKIIYVDQSHRIFPEDFRSDGLHLLPSGDVKLGMTWFQALQQSGVVPGSKE